MATVNALKKYVVDSNDALELKLVRTPEDVQDDTKLFKPEMTHQVFGDSESIFGYTNLRVKLFYSAASLQTYIGIKYSGKIDNPICTETKDIQPDDVLSKIIPYLAPGFYTNIDEFRNFIHKDEKFVPYGSLHHSFVISTVDTIALFIWTYGMRMMPPASAYTCAYKQLSPNKGLNISTPAEGVDRKFEVYHNDATNKEFVAFHSRLQTFLLWYVDGSSFIDIDDPQWTFFTIYERYQSHNGDLLYAVSGYSTVYQYYAYPKHIRPRISQMLILPPFQKLGLGAELLESIYMHFTPMSNVVDITVEDPSDEFQRLRDFVDCRKCCNLESFSKMNLEKGFNKEIAMETRLKYKLSLKQVRRVYEILRLKETNINNEQQYRSYRLAVKQRLNSPYQKQQNVLKKLKKMMKPDDFIAAMSIFGTEERLNKLSSDYKRLEETYKLVIERLLSQKCNGTS